MPEFAALRASLWQCDLQPSWLEEFRHPAARHSLELLRDLIQERLGLHFGDTSLPLLADRIAERALQLDLESFLDYYYLLKYDPAGEAEWQSLTSALTINETYFWRESDALQLGAKLVGELQSARPGQRVSIWHAACSTGEEPYSLAIALAETGAFERGPIDLLASDIDTRVLETARRGRYRARSLRHLPEDWRHRYLPETEPGTYELVPALRQRVRFFTHNLARPEAFALLSKQDLIFCRNVLIYFNDSQVQRLALTFSALLKTPGYLFVGSSESLLRFSHPLEFWQRDGVIGYRHG